MRAMYAASQAYEEKLALVEGQGSLLGSGIPVPTTARAHTRHEAKHPGALMFVSVVLRCCVMQEKAHQEMLERRQQWLAVARQREEQLAELEEKRAELWGVECTLAVIGTGRPDTTSMCPLPLLAQEDP
eukprot:2023281-Pyramimonas_sp.AAC.2